MTRQVLTTSSIQSFKGCRRRYWYEYVVGLRREVDAKPLRMGSAGHLALDVLKQGGTMDAATVAVYDYYERFPPLEGEADQDRVFEQITVAALVSGWYWRWYMNSQPMAVFKTEFLFRTPIYQDRGNTRTATPNYDFAGKIDGIVKLEDGRIAILEHKFLSEDVGADSDLWKRLRLDHQISHYVWGGRFRGFDVSSVLYDVIRKPTIKPTSVDVLDADGLKIVLDVDGKRVRNLKKAKKSCERCQGTGHWVGEPCDCTQGEWRQTGNSDLGYTVQTRPMTPDEWPAKLVADIASRPDYYFARVEIARLDAEVDEALDELWDVQRTIRDTELTERWYRTVGRDTCPWCPFFSLCHTKFDPCSSSIPDGFLRIEDVHPELEPV